MTKTDVVIFLTGAAVGAVVGYYVGKKHTENEYEYEYTVPPMEDDEEAVDPGAQHHPEEPTVDEFVNDVYKYPDLCDKYETLAKTHTDSDKYIEEIVSEQFGELNSEGIEDCMLIYRYKNDIYVQEDSQVPIIDPWKILGLGVMGKLADTDIKMMYVRNHRMKCDYEIVQLDEEWEEMEE